MSQISTTSVSIHTTAAPHSPNHLDDPQNVDVAAEHWNDPNYDIDIVPRPSTIIRNAKDVRNARAVHTASDLTGEPQTGSRRNYDPDLSTSNDDEDDNE
jgi:hypothetical protein